MQKKPSGFLPITRGSVTKMLLVMKFTAVLLLAASLQVSAHVNGQKVTLSEKNVSLEKVFRAIKKQTGYAFFFDENWLSSTDRVSIQVRSVPLETALDLCFANQPFTYTIIGKTVVLKKLRQPATSLTTEMPVVQLREVRGVVTGDKGEPLAGVSVMIKGTSRGTTTNSNGEFVIDAEEGDLLEFSIVGYTSVTRAVGNAARLTVTMDVNAEETSEVVVIGYGTAKKSDLSAAVAVVPDLRQIQDRPVLNVQSMIQGKVPGVTAVSNGGHPNSSPSITIRGMGSRSGESVLFVVDGVPGAPFNPVDVESITVLKDAASAAIYGAFTGAAGVILITTRQAGKGQPTVEYNGFVGAKKAWRLPQSLTAADEAKVSNLAYTNAGYTPLSGWDANLNSYAQVTRTDWVDAIFRTGMIQRHTVTLNAGTEKFSTMLQAQYANEEGTLLNTYNKNLSLRFNANYQFTDKIRLRQDVYWNNNDNRGTETSSGYSGTILSAIYMPRSATVYYEDGSFGGVGPRDSDFLGIHGDAINPVGTLLRNRPYTRNGTLQSVTELGINQIVNGLNFISRFSYRQGNSLYKNFEPKRTEPGKPNNQNTLSYSSGNSYHWFWENTANYARVFNKHSVGAMLSMTAQENGGRNFNTAAKGFENEADWAQFFVNATIFDQSRPGDGESKDRNASYVGRLSYSWADRYFLTGSYRYDIAGRFARVNRGKGLPGVTAAWKISSEPFFHLQGVDLLKIRASWGRIGNMAPVPLYYGYSKLSSNHTYQVGDEAPQSNAIYVGERNNPFLAWETSQQTDIGLDITLLNKRLTVNVDYFDKLTYDLIKRQDSEWPATMGLGAPLINQGRIANKGVEVAAFWNDRIGELTYEIGGNIATLKNRVEYIDDNPGSFWGDGASWRSVLNPYRSIVGQPLYSYWLVQTDGIFQTDAEASGYSKDGAPIQPYAKAGDLKFVDQNNDGVINDGDRVYMGSAFPKLTYGINANLAWKNFDLSIFFQGVSGVKLFHAFKQSTLNGAEQGYNRWDKILEAWSPENTGASIPRISASDANKNFQTASDWYLEDGDYLRLKNLLLGYTFTKMPWNAGFRVYISADNLLTFTKYTGMDPEVGGYGLDGGQFPVSRTIALGVKVNL